MRPLPPLFSATATFRDGEVDAQSAEEDRIGHDGDGD
jgi:hypothetical protein